MKIEEGKKAPGFTLPDEKGNKVRLSELNGSWVILYFYPQDDTPGCTIEAQDFSKNLNHLAKTDQLHFATCRARVKTATQLPKVSHQ